MSKNMRLTAVGWQCRSFSGGSNFPLLHMLHVSVGTHDTVSTSSDLLPDEQVSFASLL